MFKNKNWIKGFGDDLTVHAKFVAYLEEEFADYLLPKSYGWSATLDTIWASGKRLIIGYDQSSVVPLHDSIWPCVTHQWGNVRTISDLYTYLNGIETNALRCGDKCSDIRWNFLSDIQFFFFFFFFQFQLHGNQSQIGDGWVDSEHFGHTFQSTWRTPSIGWRG